MKNNKNPLVSIIIVNWNGLSQMKDCLESLSKISYKNYEVIVSDNGSTDGSLQYLDKVRNKFPKLVVVENGKNLGYAGGNNMGYEKASGNMILLLNNDTIITPGFLEPLVDALLSNNKIGGVQPKILSYPQKDIIDSVGSYFINSGFLYHMGHNRKDEGRYEANTEIFTMKGACMLFRREVIERVGGIFDSDYFAYFEETDLCQRIWITGYKVVYTPKSKIYHKGGETAKKLNSGFVLYNSYKNRYYTYLKNFELSTLIKIFPMHLIYCEVSTLAYLLTLNFQAALATQKALLWNLQNIKKIREGRKRIKQMRVVSDSSYLPKVTRSVRLSYYYHLFVTALAGYES
jgi:GT2 family glycosyltransferase